MKYIDEFRQKEPVKKIAQAIKKIMPAGEINIMEVCGTHTQNFFRFGIDKLLPENLHLISGPGCPVCVSSQGYIDTAIRIAQERNTLILTFGDMLRVPGTKSSLEKERAKGARVAIVYSALDAIKVARTHPGEKIVFLGVGFETTAPTIGLSIISAKKACLKNLSFLNSLKLITPAMEHLLKDPALNIDAFLCPGHVSSIIGTKPYEFVPARYRIGCCVAGFEPVDILEGLYILIKQLLQGKPRVENQYIRLVTKRGNLRAQKVIRQVFTTTDVFWRGLGKIAKSGLKIKKDFSQYDARKVFSIQETVEFKRYSTECRCAEVLKGIIRPNKCALFRKTCTPANPYGPCMVSTEGACNAYYKYQR